MDGVGLRLSVARRPAMRRHTFVTSPERREACLAAESSCDTPSERPVVRLRAVFAEVLGMVAMSFAAVAAWILAGGNQAGLPAPLSDWLPSTTPIDTGVEGSAPVHLESTPSGAEVRIDGIRRGQTPATLGLAPGSNAHADNGLASIAQRIENNRG